MRTRSPTRGGGPSSGGAAAAAQDVLVSSAPSPQAAAVRAPTAKPRSAASTASARQASSPRRPWRAASSAQPATAPGTVTERGPRSSTGWTGVAPAGAGPAASRPLSSPSRQTSANASPPTPVDIGSVTHSTAAAASAASAALPPRSSARSPARVASGWLVATMASAATDGGRPNEWRKLTRPGGAPEGARFAV